MEDEVWEDNLYKNWVRGAKGLEFLQEGLKEFVGDKALVCRDQQLRIITKVPIVPLLQCIQCTSEILLPEHSNLHKACNRTTCIHQTASNCFGSRPRGRRKCPNGICSELYDAIVKDHCYNDPLWKNSYPGTWSSDPHGWSYMKCFETTKGPGTSAQETDASGLLSILINNRSIQNWLACHNIGLNVACPFYKARYIRNEILHKSKMELEDHTLDEYIDTFITVLEDPKCLLSYAGSQDAVQKLQKLKSKQINISQMDEKNILKIRKEALTELEEKKNEAVTEIEDSISKGLTDLNTNKADALKEMYKERNEASEEIKDKVSTGLTDINTTREDALKEISKERNEASKEIKDKVSTGLTDLNTNRDDTLKEMSKERNEASEEIKDKVSSGLTDLNTIRADALKEMSKERNEASEEIKDKVSSGLTDLNTKGVNALQKITEGRNLALGQINDKISSGLTELTVKDEEVLYEMSKRNTDALEKIKSATSSGLTELNGKSADALKQISGERAEVVDEIKDMASAVIAETTDARKEAVQKISATGTEVLMTINDRHQKILTEMEETKSNLLAKQTNHEPLSAQVKTPVLGEDEAYLKMKTDLRDNLISFYRDQHGTISVSPLIEEETPVLEFYVMPEIYSVNVQRTDAGVKEVKTPVTPIGNVFYKVNKSCRKIYLTADAGLGKTAFSKRLALTWCHAKKPHTEEGQFFSQEEIQAMHEFRFVFLLFLRDSSSECDIVDLIWTQVVSQLPPLYTRKHLENILFKERCLVILDGLDEWCHPSNSCKQKTSSIPHRKAWEQTAILTTTRPWKLSVSGLHSSQIDQKLELMGLNQNSANTLKKSVISHLCADKNDYEVKHDVEEFTRTLQEKQISDLETIPLLLTYLLFLWCNRIELGQSQCELYSQITELLLSRTVQNYQELSPKVDLHQDDTPQCLSQQTHCTQFYSLLKDLGQLAYQTLFKETKIENTLVFDSSVAEQCLNKECLTFCLKTGIITQSKVPGTLLQQKSKVSFAHKTVQEYLAALYIRSTPDQTSVPETVLSKCTCVKDILEMSKILIFLSGFNVNVSSLISRELMKIINEDEITRDYRSSLGKIEPLKQFQDMCISCCKELQHDPEVSFCLQDVFIDGSCQQEQYRENLKQLTSRNKQNIISLYIDIDRYSHSPAPYSSAQEVIEYFALSDLENIEKIHYNGEYNDRDILPLLKSSVQSLSLSCIGSSWSDLLSEKVTSLQNLEAIKISSFKMSHKQLTLLYDYISHRHCMREIELWHLECSDHGEDSCTGCSLELSKHSQLRKISLWYIPVSELNINMSSLEECKLEELSNPDLVLSFINCVPADSKVNTFGCSDLESSAAIETIQQTLPLLVHVKSVVLRGINLGNINLCSSEMVNLECVSLWCVTMPASLLRAIVTVLQQLTQTVTVDIRGCNITPESEFVTVKEEIKQSSQFRVREDWEDKVLGKIFEFETIKDGD